MEEIEKEKNDEKLKEIFNTLTDDQKNEELICIPYDMYNTILDEKERITLEIPDTLINNPLFIGYFGLIDLVRVSNGEIILKPLMIKEFIKQKQGE